MGSMAHCMDAFLTTHTRLVVIVDGLDSCEQEKLLQVCVVEWNEEYGGGGGTNYCRQGRC